MSRHGTIDDRSLAFGQAVADRLREDPELLRRARRTLTRWLATASVRARPALLEWLAALDESADAAAVILTGTDERAVRLRQSNPFAGVLSQSERIAILKRFQERDRGTRADDAPAA
jgi:hypothetical protein